MEKVREKQCVTWHTSQAYVGMGQLATELTISADEFENYDIFMTPTSLAFHLREFNVSPLVSQPSQVGAELTYGMSLYAA
jgi:cell cycle checkpoint control protein RAD9A